MHRFFISYQDSTELGIEHVVYRSILPAKQMQPPLDSLGTAVLGFRNGFRQWNMTV